jgi:hypothetical protein
VSLADVQPSQAYVWYPWCALYGGRLSPGTPVRGFTSFGQCMATVSGSQGYCVQNPWTPEYSYAPPPRKKYKRQTHG